LVGTPQYGMEIIKIVRARLEGIYYFRQVLINNMVLKELKESYQMASRGIN
jgi:hypothetical protein